MIPKKVKVGGMWYSVVYPYIFEEEDNYQGLHDENACVLKISDMYGDRKRPYARVSETLLHELIHAVDAVYNNSMLDHDLVDIYTTTIYSVLKDNDLRKIPKKLYIMGMEYNILYPYTYSDIDCSVSVNLDQLEIRIDGELCLQRALVCIWYAILSCIESSVSLQDKDDDNKLMNMRLAQGMYQVYMDNELWKVIK